MHQPSSSTSSSKRNQRLRLRAVLVTSLWTLLALVLIDAALQLAFPMPRDARQMPGSVTRYFNYGTSIEGKLTQMIGPTDEASTPVIVAGWIDKECRHGPPPAADGKLGVTIYGMSFSEHVAQQLNRIDPSLAITGYAGPGAPLNHSFACFQAVTATGKDDNPVQIIGILASSVSRMLTIGGLTTSFEGPSPFTYPRYRLEGGKLVAVEPVLRLPSDLRDGAKMAAYRSQLAREDAYFDPLLQDANLLDHSLTAKLLRRAYAQAESRKITAKLGDDAGFVDNPEVGPVMRAMLLDFAHTVRSQGKVPMVILFQDRGFGAASLYRMLGPALEQAAVPFVSTHDIASVDDPGNFVADGHFTPAVDRKIALVVLNKMRETLAMRHALPPSNIAAALNKKAVEGQSGSDNQ